MTDVLTFLCKNGLIKLDYETVLAKAAEAKDMKVIWWVIDQLGLPRSAILNFIPWAASHGYLSVLDVIHTVHQPTPNELSCDKGWAFYQAAQNGHLDVLKWLHNHGNFTKTDFMNRAPIGAAARFNHLDVLKWLHRTFTITYEDIDENACYTFRAAAGNGHLDVLKWLHHTVKIPEKVVDTEFFMDIINRGHVHVADWVNQNFHRFEEAFQMTPDYTRFKNFDNRRHPKMAQWLETNFGCKF